MSTTAPYQLKERAQASPMASQPNPASHPDQTRARQRQAGQAPVEQGGARRGRGATSPTAGARARAGHPPRPRGRPRGPGAAARLTRAARAAARPRSRRRRGCPRRGTPSRPPRRHQPGQRRLDAGRPQEVVHPVLREGVDVACDHRVPWADRRRPSAHPVPPRPARRPRRRSIRWRGRRRRAPARPAAAPPRGASSAATCGPRKVQAVTAQGSRPLCGLRRGHEEPGACERGGDGVRRDAERHQHHRGVVDGVQQPRHLVVVGAQECRRGGRRRRQHDGIGLDGPPATVRSPAGRRRRELVDRGGVAATPRPAPAGPWRSAPTSDAMPPSSDQKSGGPSGSGAGTSARRARMRPPRRWAAASSGGKVAAADMSSTEPAWMPPISGSTRVSTTRRPSLCATRGPMERSPIGPRCRAGAARRRGQGRARRDAHDARAGRVPDPCLDPECCPRAAVRRRPLALLHRLAPRS